jgi:hypothetical protein
MSENLLLVISGAGVIIAAAFWWYVHSFKLRQKVRKIAKRVPQAPKLPEATRTIAGEDT